MSKVVNCFSWVTRDRDSLHSTLSKVKAEIEVKEEGKNTYHLCLSWKRFLQTLKTYYPKSKSTLAADVWEWIHNNNNFIITPDEKCETTHRKGSGSTGIEPTYQQQDEMKKKIDNWLKNFDTNEERKKRGYGYLILRSAPTTKNKNTQIPFDDFKNELESVVKELKMSYKGEYTGIPLRKNIFDISNLPKKYANEFTFKTMYKVSSAYPLDRNLMDNIVLIKVIRKN